MKKREVDHVLRAAGRITGEKQFIIIGSQSLHGKFPDLADDLVKSFEVDLMVLKNAHRTEWLEVIGAYSPFHESFGYYADPVDRSTATLPKGWKGRLVNLPPGDTEGVLGLCLDPHDLAIAKYVARREKDLIFTRELARRGLVSQERLLALVDQTAVADEVRERIRTYITKDFSPAMSLDESQGQESHRGKHSPIEDRSVFEEMEEIRAKAAQDWLKLRRRQTGRSYDIGADRTGGRERDDLANESGTEADEDTPE
jgi:hypothetical protein